LPWQGRGFLQLTWPDNYITYWRFVGRSVADHLAQSLHDAASQANTQHTNAPLIAADAQIPTAMQAWRVDVGARWDQASDSAGAYWTWSLCAKSADTSARNVMAVQIAQVKVGHGQSANETVIYYTNAAFGRVAATVNVGRPSTSYHSVNGIVARFQAYTSAQLIFLDMPLFPDADGVAHPTPAGYIPRR
jgi:hypothetical protein